MLRERCVGSVSGSMDDGYTRFRTRFDSFVSTVKNPLKIARIGLLYICFEFLDFAGELQASGIGELNKEVEITGAEIGKHEIK